MNAAPMLPSEAPADDVEIYVQPTPSPRARKFICERPGHLLGMCKAPQII